MRTGYFEQETRPEELDFTSSPTTVFIRRNIEEVERTDPETGETKTMYAFDEIQMPKADYIKTLHDRQDETDEALQELILATFGGE